MGCHLHVSLRSRPPVTRSHQDTADMAPALTRSQEELNTGILEVARLGHSAYCFTINSANVVKQADVLSCRTEYPGPLCWCPDGSLLSFSGHEKWEGRARDTDVGLNWSSLTSSAKQSDTIIPGCGGFNERSEVGGSALSRSLICRNSSPLVAACQVSCRSFSSPLTTFTISLYCK